MFVRLLTALAIVALLAPLQATLAQNSPVVRVSATPAEVSVGQLVTLQVTVLAPTWFTSPPLYPSFELPNAVTRLPPDSSYPTNELVDGETWSGIVRRYQIHPLLGATYRLTGLTMQVTYAHPQSYRPFMVDVAVPDTEFRAIVPAAAARLDPYLAGTRLALEREIVGELDTLQTGDALVIRYTAALEGMPAIFLPRLADAIELPGVSVYADEPILEDPPGGVGLGHRSERLTVIFESAGEFTVPGVELEWWNTRRQAIETASVPAFTVSVAGPVPEPATGAPATSPESGVPVAFALVVVAGGLGLALGMVLLVRLTPGLQSRWQDWRLKRRQSEVYAFAHLRSAVRARDAVAVHRALLAWLARLEPGLDARSFARLYGNPDLQAQIEQLARTLYAGATENANLRTLGNSLAAARRVYRHRNDRQPYAVPPLNP